VLLAITANRLCDTQSKLDVWDRWLSNVFLHSCVESLIGPDTVNTIPPVTLGALRDYGRPRQTLHEDIGTRSRYWKVLQAWVST
jgi:hypothetical protein